VLDLGVIPNSTLGILSDALLEEVSLSLERDTVHPVKGVLSTIDLGLVEVEQEAVSTELNVVAHEVCIHAEELDRNSVTDKLMFNLDSILDNLSNAEGGGRGDKISMELTCKVTMKTFVTANELIGEGQAWHEATLLKPKDCTKGTREEDSFNDSKGNEAFSKCAALRVTPSKGPLSFLGDTRESVNGTKEVVLLFLVAHICVKKKRVHFTVDVLDGNLHTIETTGFRELDFSSKVLNQVLIHNAIRGCKESKDMFNEVLLIGFELLPVGVVTAEINFFNSPEASQSVLVEAPVGGVPDGEEDKSIRIGVQKGFSPRGCLGLL